MFLLGRKTSKAGSYILHRELVGHLGAVVTRRTSEDGKFLASGGTDGTKVWDVRSDRPLEAPQSSAVLGATTAVIWVKNEDDLNLALWSGTERGYLICWKAVARKKAYSAYQQALYLLPNPKEDPKLWYGIGILYDRYGSLDHAEEAFSSVLRMDKDLDFDKANEILFRLGIIYKQQGKYNESLNCFDRILRNPPNPLAHADIWFQIGHVYEQQKDLPVRRARKTLHERVVQDNPGHAKVLQQLGWLYHQDGSSFQNQDLAIQYLTKSLEADPSDAQSWYLLGRAYMAGQKYNKAYEAYQQAVYRDGRNPTFWCSIGVLYFQINQYRDALDAYSRAIRINPYISEVWFDLGSLYESCNNQISDAMDAHARE
ncbi:Transcriptional corepressor [Mycena chlorophos]|uniref:Transcriptional corepressor n=1 Tax=Mycena chlorophos TaxID=658473 RepID=A0A8H6SIQ5_MYCCL|nr:Transcriptional corepressor [Mycena chlorophos]